MVGLVASLGAPTLLHIVLDPTAARARIDSPEEGQPAATTIEIAGMTFPGWRVAIAGVDIPTDAKGRFATTVQRSPRHTVVIAIEGPTHGIEYFLRRYK